MGLGAPLPGLIFGRVDASLLFVVEDQVLVQVVLVIEVACARPVILGDLDV